jgi:hypothetical protein
MLQLRLSVMACIVFSLAAAFPAHAQNQNPVMPSQEATPLSQLGSRATGSAGSVSSPQDAYPTAVQCMQVQNQAQGRENARLSPKQQRMLEVCERMGEGEATPDNTAPPPR